MPNYYEVNYNNYLYVISKFSFIPDENEIYFSWSKIHIWDKSKDIEEFIDKYKEFLDEM